MLVQQQRFGQRQTRRRHHGMQLCCQWRMAMLPIQLHSQAQSLCSMARRILLACSLQLMTKMAILSRTDVIQVQATMLMLKHTPAVYNSKDACTAALVSIKHAAASIGTAVQHKND
jgi:hypothetical protein